MRVVAFIDAADIHRGRDPCPPPREMCRLAIAGVVLSALAFLSALLPDSMLVRGLLIRVCCFMSVWLES